MDSSGGDPGPPKIFVAFIGLMFGVIILGILVACLEKTGLLKCQEDTTGDNSDQTRPQQQQALFGQNQIPLRQQFWFDQNQIPVQMSPPPPVLFRPIPNPQLEFATMERFLNEMENEKPIRFSSNELKALTNNFSAVLGSGGYGVVYRGEFTTAIPVAVKVLTSSSDKRIEEQFMAEVSAIGRANHINLVRLYGFCFERDMRALIYEFMENGSLDELLFDPKKEIGWEKLREITIGTAKGLAYLHEECRKRIIHYDIKPANILLDGDLRPKVSDFGLAKLCSVDVSQITMTGCRGTPGYAAPELWEPFPVSHKCDIYSFGIVLFETLARRRHHDQNVKEESKQWLPRWAWEALSNGELSEMLSELGIEEKDMEKAVRMAMTALWCIQQRPEARPMISNVAMILEGSVEIEPPPCPFKSFHGTAPSSGGSDGLSSSSATSESAVSKPHHITKEIQTL
ncbi:PREDICTED: rust resistance kinase Lr10-like [Tarenaya hassleriana]|uniref:rust resistance kinase Lr10-like n=1 Tax=Tarenaya hassleriana TaxID=28532 RepID=UPI00053C3E35|nr:PREDICTED: rust resistance kinase Lr10-like [Tarenaya hassleriana]